MKIFYSPFNIDVNTVPEDFQIEVIDMQNNIDLKKSFFFSKHRTFFIHLMRILKNVRFWQKMQRLCLEVRMFENNYFQL